MIDISNFSEQERKDLLKLLLNSYDMENMVSIILEVFEERKLSQQNVGIFKKSDS